MSILAVGAQALAQDVAFTEGEMVVSLVGGRRIAVPLAWFPRLANASRGQLENWELLGDGEGIHWPDLDEDISVAGLLRGDKVAGWTEPIRPRRLHARSCLSHEQR